MVILLADTALSHVDISTLLTTGSVSAVIAGMVTVAVNLLLGGPMEVRKQRAVERFQAHRAVNESIRIQLNAVRILRSQGSGWTTREQRIVEFTDGFDDVYNEMQESYQGIRAHLAGTDDVEPEQTVARAVLAAGIYTARVQHFRREAIGYLPDALHAERSAMLADLSTAQELLTAARDCLGPATPRRLLCLQRLRKRLDEIEQLAGDGSPPRTPLNYYVALSRARPGEQHVRRGPYQGRLEA